MERVIIAAVSENNVIGKDGDIPWHYPEDLKHFKQKTLNHPVIMGRKTYYSLPEQFRPLPGRTNIVLTRGEMDEESVIVANSLEDAYAAAEKTGAEKAFIIGGASIYEQTMDDADRLVITRIHAEFEGDTFFPTIGNNWAEDIREDHEEFSFTEYVRN